MLLFSSTIWDDPKSVLGCIHTCRSTALFRNRDSNYYNVAFYSWCSSLSHSEVSIWTKTVNTSHVQVNCPLIGQSSTIYFQKFCGHLNLIIYHFEQESRIHLENIVKMYLLRRAIRQHYKMKRCALILNGEDLLTQRYHLLLFTELT